MTKKLEAAAKKVFELRAEKSRIEKELKEATAAFHEMNVGDIAVHGSFRVVASPNRRFDAALAEEVLSKAQFTKVSKRVAQGILIKAHYPELYEQCQKDSPNPKIDIKIVED